jgi:hypothetical protein
VCCSFRFRLRGPPFLPLALQAPGRNVPAGIAEVRIPVTKLTNLLTPFARLLPINSTGGERHISALDESGKHESCLEGTGANKEVRDTQSTGLRAALLPSDRSAPNPGNPGTVCLCTRRIRIGMRHFDHVPVRPFLLQMGNLADARAVVLRHHGLRPDGRCVNGPTPE